jgi:hypothetical protein
MSSPSRGAPTGWPVARWWREPGLMVRDGAHAPPQHESMTRARHDDRIRATCVSELPRACHMQGAATTCGRSRRADITQTTATDRRQFAGKPGMRRRPARLRAKSRFLCAIDKLPLFPALIRFVAQHSQTCRRRRFVARHLLRNSRNFACEASRKSAAKQSLCQRVRPLILPRESSGASLFFCASLNPHDKHG